MRVDSNDCIIVDSPPVLGLSDALQITALVDATLFVVKFGAESKSAIRDSVERLRDVDANLVGTVLNLVDTKSSEHRSYFNSDYYNYTSSTQ